LSQFSNSCQPLLRIRIHSQSSNDFASVFLKDAFEIGGIFSPLNQLGFVDDQAKMDATVQ